MKGRERERERRGGDETTGCFGEDEGVLSGEEAEESHGVRMSTNADECG